MASVIAEGPARSRFALGVGAGLALVAAHAWLLASQPWVAHFDRFLALELGAFALYAVAAWSFAKRDDRRSLIVIWVIALAMRVLLLGSFTELSDDIGRYLWDGRVLHDGGNPFVTPPDDQTLSHLKVAGARTVAHADVPSVYPPLAQLAFWSSAVLHASERGWRLALVACELIALAVLQRALRNRRMPVGRLAIYAWHPLPVLEVASSGHVDALALPFFIAVLMLIPARRALAAATSLALATLAKLQSMCVAPLLFVLRARGVAALVVALGVIALAYIPFVAPGFLDGTRRYGAEWSFNSAAFELVRGLCLRWQDALKTYVEQGQGNWGGIAYGLDERVMTRAILALLLGLATIAILCTRTTLERQAVALCAATFLLSPTAHPWYSLTLIAALALAPVPPLLLLTGLLVISYRILPAYHATGTWQEEPVTLLAEYGLPLLWLAAMWARSVTRTLAMRRSARER